MRNRSSSVKKWNGTSTVVSPTGGDQRKSRLRAPAMVLVAVMLALVASPALRASAQTAATAAVPALDAEEAAFCRTINTYRAQHGLGALRVSTTLAYAATWDTNDMAAKNYFSHTDSAGRDPFQRMTAFGYSYSTEKGENIAAGNATAAATFAQWKASAGHNQNMLTAAYKVIGISRSYSASSTYGWYWNTDFGGYIDASLPCPTTTTTTSSVAERLTPGIARFGGNSWTFYTTNVANGTGITDQYVTWPGTVSTDVPLVGDWTGGGKDTPGLARFANGTWTFYTTNIANGTGITDQYVTWPGTVSTDVPLVGDWTGGGKDTPGLARFANGTWTFYTTNIANGTGITDQYVTWPGTASSDVPLVGDWTGTGKETPGLARFANGTWTFDTTNIANGTAATNQHVTWPGTASTDKPLVGDWAGHGKDTAGLARLGGSTRTFYMTNVSNGTGITDQYVTWTGQLATDTSLVGDWTGK